MARARGRQSAAYAFVRSVGAWLHPVSGFRPHSQTELELQDRVGLVSLFCIATGAITMLAAGIAVIPDPVHIQQSPQFSSTALEAATFLVLVSVFAPQAIFRTRSAALTRQVLDNPTSPIPPWRTTIITFDAVLVGAMLSGLYFEAELSLLFFGMALVIRVMVTSRRALEADPNARFHNMTQAWTTAATGGVAFAIVKPLSGLVSLDGSIAPLVLAALVAMYVGLVFNAIERWVNADRGKWAFARDAVDLRRIIVAIVSAVIAWTVAVMGEQVGGMFTSTDTAAGTLAGLGTFLAAWLLLWFVSIQMWTRDAMRTLRLWADHQSEVMGRLADGSLSAELAARASIPITARIAASVFGATKAMVVLDNGRGRVTTHLVAVDRYANSPQPEARDVLVEPSMRMEVYPAPDHPNMTSITVAGWLWTGWFTTRSSRIVGTFTELASASLLAPIIAANDDLVGHAFDTMFDSVNRWPTLSAFEQAVDHMQRRADDNPHTDSLILGVYAIDEFGALEGGRFEQAAVAQVMRLAMGHPDFAGHDMFYSYEKPGRVWVALSGGPIIRNGIGVLRDLQQFINEHGSVPSARLDVDVHVSVSFGYAAHQVDEFTCTGLMIAALNRLAIDQSSRDPFTVENLITYDITPEDITGEASTPVTAVNVLNLLVSDNATTTASPFTTRFVPVCDVVSGRTEAVLAEIGWHRSFGSLDMSDANAFLTLVNRQRRLAAEATRIIIERLQNVFAEADHLGLEQLPIIVRVPASLLHPDAREYALPNLITPTLDRRECSRTVLLFNTVPSGAVQALRVLTDRGLNIAVTAAAAAAADPTDLLGWQRWGILFPQHVIQGPNGIDALTVQQTASAIATHGTRLIGIADQFADPRDLVEHSITWTIDPAQTLDSVRESVGSRLPRDS
jgi:hypothetical protein